MASKKYLIGNIGVQPVYRIEYCPNQLINYFALLFLTYYSVDFSAFQYTRHESTDCMGASYYNCLATE